MSIKVKRENTVLAVVVFLLVLVAFGLGFIFGAKIYQPCNLNIYP